MGGATKNREQIAELNEFLSTLPMGGATVLINSFGLSDYISIHAPHGGSDVSSTFHCIYSIISIHAPHGGSDSKTT